MVENSLPLPTNIQVKNSDDSTDHYIIEGDIIKKSSTCILLEETTLWKKSSDTEYTPTLMYHKPDGIRPYVVIVLDNLNDSLVKQRAEYRAKFFDNFTDAKRYYSCFATIEREQ